MNATEIRALGRESTDMVYSPEGTTMPRYGNKEIRRILLAEIAAQLSESNELARLRLRWEVTQVIETGTVKGNSENELERKQIREEVMAL